MASNLKYFGYYNYNIMFGFGPESKPEPKFMKRTLTDYYEQSKAKKAKTWD